jgi:hypothetical protein
LESDKDGKQRAVGVKIDHDGSEVEIKNVRGDVILSSGGFYTLKFANREPRGDKAHTTLPIYSNILELEMPAF